MFREVSDFSCDAGGQRLPYSKKGFAGRGDLVGIVRIVGPEPVAGGAAVIEADDVVDDGGALEIPESFRIRHGGFGTSLFGK